MGGMKGMEGIGGSILWKIGWIRRQFKRLGIIYDGWMRRVGKKDGKNGKYGR